MKPIQTQNHEQAHPSFEETEKAIDKICRKLISQHSYCPETHYQYFLGKSNHIDTLIHSLPFDRFYIPSRDTVKSLVIQLNVGMSNTHLFYPGYLRLVTTRGPPSSLNELAYYRNTIVSGVNKFKQTNKQNREMTFYSELVGVILFLKCWKWDLQHPKIHTNDYGLPLKAKLHFNPIQNRHQPIRYRSAQPTSHRSADSYCPKFKTSTPNKNEEETGFLAYFQSEQNLMKNMSKKNRIFASKRVATEHSAFIQIPTTQKRIFTVREAQKQRTQKLRNLIPIRSKKQLKK